MTSIVTLNGQAKIADAIANNTDINLTKLLVGDGGGTDITAVETMNELVNQVFEVQLTSVVRDPLNPNWIIATGLLAEDVGPFTIREVAVEDGDGQLFAVASYPATQKLYSEQGGVVTAIEVKMIIVVSDTANVSLQLSPGDTLPASRRIDTGPGLDGGGDLTQDREIKFNFLELTAEPTVGDGYIFVFYDPDTLSYKRITRQVLVAGLGGGGSGGITGASNVGDGSGLPVKGLSGQAIQVRKIKSGAGIVVETIDDDVVIRLADMAGELTA